MSKYLTGIRDLDMEIILDLKDEEIEPVLKVNKFLKDICESEIFWYRRIFKKIEYAKNENLKEFKELLLIPIEVEKIREMKSYFGFEKYKELNDYLKIFNPKMLYFIYHFISVNNENNIDSFFKVDREKLPEYINYDKLIHSLRRKYSGKYFAPRTDRIIKVPYSDFYNIPGIQLFPMVMPEIPFLKFKSLGLL